MEVDDRSRHVRNVPWRAVAVFIAVSFSLAWLFAVPLWLVDRQTPIYQLLAALLPVAIMFSPLVATLIVVFAMRVPSRGRRRYLGIWPLPPVGRAVWFAIIAALAPTVLVCVGIGFSVLLGWMELDLAGVEATLGVPVEESLLPLVLVMHLATIPLIAVLNAIPAFGEEVGWRGWLLSALRPLGLWPALLLSGLIWGLWHTPMALLGHNFNEPNLTGVVFTTVGFTAWGVLFGWLTLRSGSLWPAALAHGSLNASGSLVVMLSDSGAALDMKLVNPLGVSGWIVLVATTLVLVAFGQFKTERGSSAARSGET